MIGIFDSGFGGLTVFKEIKKALPEYSYVYLGDNLRAPYGGRDQEIIYEFTEQAVAYLFKQGCELVVLACNTASAEALKKLQQDWLPARNARASEAGGPTHFPDKRILGVIRPMAEEAVKASRFGKIGVVGTVATVESGTYLRELKKQSPSANIFQVACPLLVPLVEEGWLNRPETRMIIKKYLRPLKDQQIDTLILGCTHYHFLLKEFTAIGGKRIKVLDAPKIVASKLVDYLKHHPEIENKIKTGGEIKYLTTGSTAKFNQFAKKFLGVEIKAEKIAL